METRMRIYGGLTPALAARTCGIILLLLLFMSRFVQGVVMEPQEQFLMASLSGTVDGSLELRGGQRVVGDFVIVHTDHAVILLSRNLSYLDHIQLNQTNSDETIMGVTFAENNTFGVIGTWLFTIFPFQINPSNKSFVFDRSDSRDMQFELQLCWTGSAWINDSDSIVDRDVHLTHVALDGYNFLWIGTHIDYGTSEQNRVYLYDLEQEFKPGLMFRVGPDVFPACQVFVVKIGALVPHPRNSSDVGTPVQGEQHVTLFFEGWPKSMRFSNERGRVINDARRSDNFTYTVMDDDPGGMAQGIDYQIFNYRNHSYVSDDASRVGKPEFVMIGSDVFLVRGQMDVLDISMDNFDVFDIVNASGTVGSLQSVVVDADQSYIYVGDSFGTVWRVPFFRSVAGVTSWNMSSLLTENERRGGVTALMFHEPSLRLFAASADAVVALDTQDCTTHQFCSDCVSSGGLYCYWRRDQHDCVSRLIHEESDCPFVDGIVPSSIYRFEAKQVRISGDFGPDLDYGCDFTPFTDSSMQWGPVVHTNITQISGGRAFLDCEAPPFPDAQVSTVHVSVSFANYTHAYVAKNVELAYYDCTPDSLASCISDDRPPCGYCPVDVSCVANASCSDMSQWSQNSSAVEFPRIVKIDPPAAPPGFVGIVNATLEIPFVDAVPGSTYYSSSMGTFSCEWCNPDLVPFQTEPAALVVVDASNASRIVVSCAHPPSSGEIRLFVKLNGTRLNPNSKIFSGFSCSVLGTCGVCATVTGCHWCVEENACQPVSSSCAQKVIDPPECPRILYTAPSAVPLQSIDVDITLTGCPMVPWFQCIFDSTLGSAAVNGTVVTYAPPCVVRCTTPAAVLGPSASFLNVEIKADGRELTTSPHTFSTYDCADGLFCSDCITSFSSVNQRSCGWCASSLTCGIEADCASGWLEACPRMSSLDPFMGSTQGGTPLSIHATDEVFFPGFFQCIFERNGSSVSTLAKYESPTLMTCSSPTRSEGFVQLELWYSFIPFSTNSISYVYTNCSQYAASCGDCVEPVRADCGYCVDTNQCGNSAFCKKGYFIQKCPVLGLPDGSTTDGLVVDKDSVLVFTMSSVMFTFNASGNVTTMSSREIESRARKPLRASASDPGWQCRWDDSNVMTDAVVDPDLRTVSCYPPTGWTGTRSLDILHDGKAVTSSPATVRINRLRERDEIRWSSAAAIISLIITTFGILGIMFLLVGVFMGISSPVMKQRGFFGTIFIFTGAFIFTGSNFLGIAQFSSAMCIAKVVLMTFAVDLISAPIMVKVIHKFVFMNHPKRRWQPFPFYVDIIMVLVNVIVDFFIFGIWLIVEPLSATWEEKEEFDLVLRCTATHSNAFFVLLYLSRIIPLVLCMVGLLVTTNVALPFNEGRYLLFTTLNVTMVSCVALPIVFFTGVSEWLRVMLITLWITSVTSGSVYTLYVQPVYLVYLRRSHNVKSAPPERSEGSLLSRFKNQSSRNFTRVHSISDTRSGEDKMMATVVD